MNTSSMPLTNKQLKQRYGLTQWTIKSARATGFIGPITAPIFISSGSRYVTTQHQMDVYLAKRKAWEATFLDSARMTRYINSQFGGMDHEKNPDARRIGKMIPYYGISPPSAYTFSGCQNRKYWHIDDLVVFRRFIDALFDGRLQRTNNPVYNNDLGIWMPKYPSPPDFPERYTDETRDRVCPS